MSDFGPQVPGVQEDLQDWLGRQHRVERSFVTRLPGQSLVGLQLASYVKANTTTFEDWCLPGVLSAATLTTAAPSVNQILATPFVAESPYLIDALAFNVTTAAGAGGKARIGIYEAQRSGTGLFYPGALVKDCGDTDVTGTGVKSTSSLSIELVEGQLYFTAYQCGVAAPTIRAIPAASIQPAMGTTATLPSTFILGYNASSTYSATAGLPGTFPTGATTMVSVAPAVYFRYYGVSEKKKVEPVFSPATTGHTLRRSRLFSGNGTLTRTKKDYWFTVGLGVMTGASTTVLDTFDSRKNSLQPGVPFTFSEQDRDLVADEVVVLTLTRFGEPAEDLSHIYVQTDIAVGG